MGARILVRLLLTVFGSFSVLFVLVFFALFYWSAEQRLYALAARVNETSEKQARFEVSLGDGSILRLALTGVYTLRAVHGITDRDCLEDLKQCALNDLTNSNVILSPSELRVEGN